MPVLARAPPRGGGPPRAASPRRKAAARRTPGSLRDSLLSRYAECLFWLARYVERAENLARILDVNETFSRDSRGGQNWMSVLQLYGDEARFKELHGAATADSVLRFYVTDGENPTSIVSSVRSARDNARALRPLISNEMRTEINVLHRSEERVS